jgi:protein-S-isoprenylcysteine O-methyltransferase Ste14
MSQVMLGKVVGALWVIFVLYWVLTARNVKPTRWEEPLSSRARHRLPLALAAALLAGIVPWPPMLYDRFLPADLAIELTGVVMLAAGIGFAIWARRHIGTNWSATVTVKSDHTLIRSGPYAIVRHPIYTGILAGFLGTAIAVGQWRGLVAVALCAVAFLYKIRVEERQMRATFPEYEDYERLTPALIPFAY